MSKNPWFRLYSRIIDDEKLRLLAFEDRWHYVALLCLKSEGLLDDPEDSLMMRKLAVKMGLQVREVEEVGRRLREVGLIDDNYSPVSWDDLQFLSDSSKDRVKAYRDRKKASNGDVTLHKKKCNGDVTLQKRRCNGGVTVQEEEEEEDKDKDKDITPLTPRKGEWEASNYGFDLFWQTYPRKKSKGQALKSWLKLKPSERFVEIIISKIKLAKTSDDWLKQNGEFIPYPSTWINAQGWDDELTFRGDHESNQRNNTQRNEPIDFDSNFISDEYRAKLSRRHGGNTS